VLLPRAITLAVAASLIARAAGLHAQEPAPSPQAPDTSVKGYAPDAEPVPAAAAAAPAPAGAPVTIGSQLGFVDVLPTRSPEKINSLLASAAGLEAEAGVELATAMSAKEKTKGLVASKKQEISTIDGRRKVAEKNKQEGEKIALETEKKDAERHKQFLDKRVSLHQAEKETAKARKSLAEATRKALELELQLTIRRGERDLAGSGDAAVALRHDNVIHDLERKTLEAQRVQADREKQVAERHQDIAKRRLELYQAQAAAGGNR